MTRGGDTLLLVFFLHLWIYLNNSKTRIITTLPKRKRKRKQTTDEKINKRSHTITTKISILFFIFLWKSWATAREPDGSSACWPLSLLRGKYENDFNQRCVARARTLEANLMAAVKCCLERPVFFFPSSYTYFLLCRFFKKTFGAGEKGLKNWPQVTTHVCANSKKRKTFLKSDI